MYPQRWLLKAIRDDDDDADMFTPTQLGGYIEYLQRKHLAARTIQVYAAAIRRLELRLSQRLDELSASDIYAYSETLPFSHSTRKELRTALVHFYAWKDLKCLSFAVRAPKKPKGSCRAMSEIEARRWHRAACEEKHPVGAMVLVMLLAGLRRHEVCKMRADEVHQGWVRVVGKGGVSAQVPLHEDALSRLPDQEPYLFGIKGEKPLSGEALRKWMKAFALRWDLDASITPHQLRHTCLATANDASHDLRATQELARHARPETTALYTRTTRRRLESLSEMVAQAYREVG
jgi:site-specific recombinase XerC